MFSSQHDIVRRARYLKYDSGNQNLIFFIYIKDLKPVGAMTLRPDHTGAEQTKGLQGETLGCSWRTTSLSVDAALFSSYPFSTFPAVPTDVQAGHFLRL